ncbi:MAG: hypothetical protein IJB88_07700 [Clostridia bacterium]|nr:hypothetical protein [Clostridia bacterium]
MSMFGCDCSCRCSCTLWAIIASAVIGVVAAFLQMAGLINVTPAFLWVLLGIAVVYLAVLVVATAVNQGAAGCGCKCAVLNALLAGILITALFSVVLLAFGVTAGSVVSAILVGLLLIGLSLTLTSSACLVKCFANCGN